VPTSFGLPPASTPETLKANSRAEGEDDTRKEDGTRKEEEEEHAQNQAKTIGNDGETKGGMNGIEGK
jgi:hypothetical protein